MNRYGRRDVNRRSVRFSALLRREGVGWAIYERLWAALAVGGWRRSEGGSNQIDGEFSWRELKDLAGWDRS